MVKSLNVSIASERQQRKLAKDIIGDNLVAERGAFILSSDMKGQGGNQGSPLRLSAQSDCCYSRFSGEA